MPLSRSASALAGMPDRLRIALFAPTDLDAVGERWQELEVRSECSFFQTWRWTGCLAARRFTDPVLLEAQLDGRVVAMALFNRRHGPWGDETLHLGESGDAGLDTICIEYNGIVFERGFTAGLLRRCLLAALEMPVAPGNRRVSRRLVLRGVHPTYREAVKASGIVVRVRGCGRSPALTLGETAPHRSREGPSANTRYQLRRSARLYEADGTLRVERARTVRDAQLYLTELARLHQTSWTRRGHAGAFANPDFMAFHRALIARAMPLGEVDLLRVSAGGRVIGYLYNFHYRSRVLSYQSGFDYESAERHQKPGLTCHQLAIERYRAEGAVAYDFLAGESRYKTSLANTVTAFVSLEMARQWSRHGVVFRAQNTTERAVAATRRALGRLCKDSRHGRR